MNKKKYILSVALAALTVTSVAAGESLAGRVKHSRVKPTVKPFVKGGLKLLDVVTSRSEEEGEGETLKPFYMPPIAKQYVGGSLDFKMPQCSYEVFPWGETFEWENVSEDVEGASFEWETENLPVDASSVGQWGFEAKFPQPAGGPYALYDSPLLKASAPGYNSGSYYENVEIMAAGKPLIEDEGEVTNYGLLPFDIRNEGLAIHTVEFGGENLPLFGYADGSDDFWFNYTANGNVETNVNFAHIEGIANQLISPETPMVVNGCWAYAYGKIKDGAKFTLSLYPLDDEGVPVLLPVAQKTISGADIIKVNDGGEMDYLILNFKFELPVVLSASEAPVYLVDLTGFHDPENVEYFTPLMSEIPNPFELGYGLYRMHIKFGGVDEGEFLYTYVAWHENEHGEMYLAYALNLDAEYPWLDVETETLEMTGETAEVKLNTFYPAESMGFTQPDGSPLPEWLTVEGTGRYDNAVLTISAEQGDEERSAAVVMHVPGIKRLLNVTVPMSGIESVVAQDAKPIEAWDITGRSVSPSLIVNGGIYIVRYNDGSIKRVMK